MVNVEEAFGKILSVEEAEELEFVPTSTDPRWRGKFRCRWCKANGYVTEELLDWSEWWGDEHGLWCAKRPKEPSRNIGGTTTEVRVMMLGSDGVPSPRLTVRTGRAQDVEWAEVGAALLAEQGYMVWLEWREVSEWRSEP